MPRIFYPDDEIIDETFESDSKLEKELEQLKEKRERLQKLPNEAFDRVITKINNIENYLKNKKNLV